MTAQETFRAMLREDVAPSLRRLGLKGSGQVYTIPSSTHWAIVAFQKSAYSDADLVRFTLNLTVARKDEWAAAYAEKQPFIGRRPMPNTYVPVGSSWHSRIGHLMPSKQDHWWDLYAAGNQEHVGGEVVAALREYGLPAMRERMV